MKRAGGTAVIAGTIAERYAALAAADVLVTDISSDLVDFLALDRPYVVLNASEFDSTAFALANPSSAAGTVLDLGSVDTLGTVVGDAIASDAASAARVALAKSYLGDLSRSPEDVFLAEVDRALDLVHSTRAARVLPVPEEQPA